MNDETIDAFVAALLDWKNSITADMDEADDELLSELEEKVGLIDNVIDAISELPA